ncbi:MAG TPA: hypothetical protein VGB52_01085 [Actinomycetota bacterium]
MERFLGILVALVALALMGRWGVRSTRLRREHGPPPPGAVRRILVGVTVGYVIAGGMLVWWLLGDLIEPGWVQLFLAIAASAASFRAGVALESRGLVPRRRAVRKDERVDPEPFDR